MDKRSLTERDICTKFILRCVKRTSWQKILQTNRAPVEQEVSKFHALHPNTLA